MCQKGFKGRFLFKTWVFLMGIAVFTVPTDLKRVNASDLAKRIGSCVARVLYNGIPDDIVARIETAQLTGGLVEPGKGLYQFGFEIWSGKTVLGDLYLMARDTSSEVRVEAMRITQDHADLIAREYLK